MSDHPTRQGWSEERLVLAIEEDDFTAYCSADADGHVYFEEEQISEEPISRESAPFPFDIVFHDPRAPTEAEVQRLADRLPEEFADEFDSTVDAVWEEIEGEDDPVDAIMDLDPEEL